MKIYFLTIFLVFGFFMQSQQNCGESRAQKANKKMPEQSVKFDKLPDGANLTDEVREEIKNENGGISYKIITVEEKLKAIGAKYESGKLVDAGGREIRFYKPPVRGASEGFEEDRKQRERDERELRDLKKNYTVIVLYVNPLKVS